MLRSRALWAMAGSAYRGRGTAGILPERRPFCAARTGGRDDMKPLGRMQDHVMLARRMATAADVDLAAAYAVGALTQDEWAGMVRTCQGCGWANRCDGWLADPD